jgi:ATP-dependent RNA helicase RhlE
MSFDQLQLSRPILDAVSALGYLEPTPIQRQAIPHVLAGKDLVAIAQTGTGKTAAFALPILERLAKTRGKGIRVLVLSPTRELASQIEDGFIDYGKGCRVKSTVIFGGVGIAPQRQALAHGVDVVVATPGRLLDLMGEGRVDLSHLEVFVLDEADRMLDMGFIQDVERIMRQLPRKRQTLLFSATMPDDIDSLARRYMVDPVRVAVTPPATTVEKVAQSVFFVDQSKKRDLVLHLVSDRSVRRALVFTRTKHGADRAVKVLQRAQVAAVAIHGNKSQSARERALEGLKQGTVRVLVATDIAARGLDVEDVTHVIQMDLPEVAEQYVHRIGRTARAGANGVAWAMCGADERPLLRDIERTIRMRIEVADHPFAGDFGSERETEPEARERRSNGAAAGTPARRRQHHRGDRHGHAAHGGPSHSGHASHGAPGPSGHGAHGGQGGQHSGGHGAQGGHGAHAGGTARATGASGAGAPRKAAVLFTSRPRRR